jgi:hypothetical protein
MGVKRGECDFADRSHFAAAGTDPRRTRVASPGDGLEPAEDLFDALTFLLTNRVARMTSGAIIDDAGRLARNMGSYLELIMVCSSAESVEEASM